MFVFILVIYIFWCACFFIKQIAFFLAMGYIFLFLCMSRTLKLFVAHYECCIIGLYSEIFPKNVDFCINR